MLPSLGQPYTYPINPMLFNSLEYLLFLPLVVLLFWLAPKQLRPIVLLIASYYFYMSWMRSYGLLLGGLTLVNYICALFISKTTKTAHKRLFLIAGLAINLACLALYKYTNFLLQSLWQVLKEASGLVSILGQSVPESPCLPIVLPLGISFFVFEFIHYLTDIYKGSLPIKSPVRFALFAAFFPSQIAGPIKRYQDFDRQLGLYKGFNPLLLRLGVGLILQGMFKKVVLGDNLSPLVAHGFDTASTLNTLDAWVCVISFALQIYYDFSGYTDIGRGSAMLFGIRLPENFNMPYWSKNLSDFWRRWHISLSSWLRDYLYIPLGGSRGNKVETARNLIATMLLGGLWHGPAWHFVIWGGFHGLGLALTHLWQHCTSNIIILNQVRQTVLGGLLGRTITFLLVSIGWVLFRAESMSQAFSMYGAMFFGHGTINPDDSLAEMFANSILPAAFTIYGCFLLFLRLRQFKQVKSTFLWECWQASVGRLSQSSVAYAITLIGITFIILGFASQHSLPFIYFQF